MKLVVVLEPLRELGEDSFGIETIVQIHVITLEGFQERIGHAVGLWATDRREARDDPQRSSLLDCLSGGVAAAIVGRPFHRMCCRRRAEAVKRHPVLRRVST